MCTVDCAILIVYTFRLAVLRIWREKYGINATYRHLVTCFHEAKRQDMVDAVCELLSAPFTPGEMPAKQKWSK